MNRYVVENEGPNEDRVKLAFAESVKVASSVGATRITILWPFKSSFQSSVVAAFLGEEATKKLLGTGSVRVSDNLCLEFQTPKTISTHQVHDVVLGIYLTKKDLQVLDAISNAEAVVFLPWDAEEGSGWVSTWEAETLGPKSWNDRLASPPPEVVDALQRLTSIVNVSAGLSHPSDKESAKSIFSELRKKGIKCDPEDIRKWATRNNWQPKHAEELAKLAKRYVG